MRKNNLFNKNKKIACALSGGVDSSVTAALLKNDGFDVSGVFMRLWKESGGPILNSEDEKRAKAVAKKLNIPFYVYDLSEEFKKRVVDCFLDEFQKGRTPNPCIVCNPQIKFGVLLDNIIYKGFDLLATGHYAKTKLMKDGKFHFFEAKDKSKDQSYFLWKLKQNQLKKVLFPLGDYYKKEVKEIGKELDLPIKNAIESKEICFVPDSLHEFLDRRLKKRSGEIIDKDGNFLGEHQGLLFYTIGQRKGIDLSGGPFYVLDKDIKRNRLIVTKNEKDLYKKQLELKEVNWILGKIPDLPLKIKARIRYRHEAVPAEVFKKSNKYFVEFKTKQRAVTPGQSAVFYKRREIFGGGIIV